MKKLFLFAAVAMVVAFSSCVTEETQEVVYSCGIFKSNFSGDDLITVDDYINSIGVPMSKKIYTGKGKDTQAAYDDADAQAKRDCDAWVAKFKKADIEALGLDAHTYFTWSMERYANPTNPSSNDIIVIGKFDWNR